MAVQPGVAIEAWWLHKLSLAAGSVWQVAGESFYQDALAIAAGGSYSQGVLRPVTVATLRRDPKNPYDQNAVAVLIQDRLVGHLPRATAPQMHGVLHELEKLEMPATCRAVLKGGWDRGSGDSGFIGVELSLATKPARAHPDDPSLVYGASSWLGGEIVDHVGAEAVSGRRKTTNLLARVHVLDERTLGVATRGGSCPPLFARVDVGDLRFLPVLVQQMEADGELVTTRARLLRNEQGLRLQLSAPFLDPFPVVDPIQEQQVRAMTADVARGRRQQQSFRWVCRRCSADWFDPSPAPNGWWTYPDGPHACPNCGSCRHSHPH